MRRAFAGLALIVGIGVVLLMPPRALVVPEGAGASSPPPLRGVMHVHTRRSDGTGTPDDIAAAAARAGLSFIITTDHGDGTRRTDSPRYIQGVLSIDAVEVSTNRGHVVALGLPLTPYPLAGEPPDVVEDLVRLGAMSIVAHPTSEKLDLQWHDVEAPFDGVEWLNGDSEWRDDHALSLVRVLTTYWFRGSESLALLLDKPVSALALWDRLSSTRSVVGVAGTDAHAQLGNDADRGGASLHIPSYEQVFRTFSISLPGVALTGNAAADAAAVIAAIRAGHVFTTIDALATPGRLSFTARAGDLVAQGGDRLPAGTPIQLRAATPGLPEARLTLFRNGSPVVSGSGEAIEFTTDGSPGAYRLEATLPNESGASVPWLVSNPIYVGPVETPAPRAVPAASAVLPVYTNGPATWAVERSERATGAIDVVPAVEGTQLLLRYALGGALADQPFVAFAADASDRIAEFDRLTFRGWASRPMRVSVQLRASPERGSGRWRRSVYLDETPREITVAFADMHATRNGLAPEVPLADVRSLLFVIDTVNTALGTSGQFWLDDVRLAR